MPMDNKHGFIMYTDYKQHIRLLSQSEKGDLLDAIFAYVDGDEPVALSPITEMAFSFIRANLDYNKSKYEKVCERRKEAINKRWKTEQKDTKVYNCIQMNTNVTDNDRREKIEDNDRGERIEDRGEKIEDRRDKHINEVLRTSCAEPSKTSPAPEENGSVVIELPLNSGENFGVTEAYVEEMRPLYPAVDIVQELRGMRGWLLSNPKNRKTKAGIKRFINGWLSREQNRGGKGGATTLRRKGESAESSSFDPMDFFEEAVANSYGISKDQAREEIDRLSKGEQNENN